MPLCFVSRFPTSGAKVTSVWPLVDLSYVSITKAFVALRHHLSLFHPAIDATNYYLHLSEKLCCSSIPYFYDSYPLLCSVYYCKTELYVASVFCIMLQGLFYFYFSVTQSRWGTRLMTNLASLNAVMRTLLSLSEFFTLPLSSSKSYPFLV